MARSSDSRQTPAGRPLEADAMLLDLLARQSVHDLIVRFATALDTQDWELLGRCFTADAIFDVGALAGVLEGGEVIVETARAAIGNLDGVQHLFGNFVIDVRDDTADATFYCQAENFCEGAPGGSSYVVWWTYHLRAVRDGGAWTIARMTLDPTGLAGNRAIFEEA